MNNNSLWSDAFYRLRRNKAAMFGGFILIVLIVVAILAPWIAPYSYSYQDLNLGASPPSSEHLLGTDVLGRDLLSRILYGARISLLVGFVATAVALIIGVSWGIVAGYAEWVDEKTKTEELESVLRANCESLLDSPLSEILFGELLLNLFEAMRKFDLYLDNDLWNKNLKNIYLCTAKMSLSSLVQLLQRS